MASATRSSRSDALSPAGPSAEGNAALLRECRHAFDWWRRFASGRTGVWLMFGWAFAEAAVWPLIPDALLVPMAAANRRRYHVPLAAAVAGSALGGLLVVLAAWRRPDAALALLEAVPLVTQDQIAVATAQLAEGHAAAFLAQPWSGVPFKVWGVVAGVQGIEPWRAAPVFIAARALRMALVATLARLLAGVAPGFVRDFSLYLAAIYVVVFGYGWWLVMR